jgi:hypothetical protein
MNPSTPRLQPANEQRLGPEVCVDCPTHVECFPDPQCVAEHQQSQRTVTHTVLCSPSSIKQSGYFVGRQVASQAPEFTIRLSHHILLMQFFTRKVESLSCGATCMMQVLHAMSHSTVALESSAATALNAWDHVEAMHLAGFVDVHLIALPRHTPRRLQRGQLVQSDLHGHAELHGLRWGFSVLG